MDTMKEINTYEYSAVPENTDFNGRITVPSLCGQMISAISQNIRVEGYGLDVMARDNRSWILIRSAFEVDSRPELYSNIYISVWPVLGNGLTYHRCVRATDGQGRELGRGTTEWCVIDKSTRKPVFPDIQDSGMSMGIPCRCPRRIRDFMPEIVNLRRIGYTDCDFNGHLNNMRYVDMMFDMLPDSVVAEQAPLRIDINYKHEALRGTSISTGLKYGSPDEFLFIARASGLTLCSASVSRKTSIS